MAQSSWPYAGDSVEETEWSKMSRLWRRSGVIDGADNELAVSAVSGELQVSVATGEAWLDGFYFSSDAAETLTLEAADLNDDRIDLVVVRSDRSAGTATLQVITGTPSASPTAPTVTQDHEGSDVFEVALAEVLVQAAASNVDGNVTDVRTFSLTPQGDAVQVVEHGADSTVARTSDAELVLWVGSVEPDNGVESDLYLRTTDGHRLYHDGSGWIDPLDNATSGAVVQRVRAQSTVDDSTTSASGVDSSLSASITPEHDDSILIVRVDGEVDYEGVSSTFVRSGQLRIHNSTDATEIAREVRGRDLVTGSSETATGFHPIALVGHYTVDSTAERTFLLRHSSRGSSCQSTIVGTNTGGVRMTIEEVRP